MHAHFVCIIIDRGHAICRNMDLSLSCSCIRRRTCKITYTLSLITENAYAALGYVIAVSAGSTRCHRRETTVFYIACKLVRSNSDFFGGRRGFELNYLSRGNCLRGRDTFFFPSGLIDTRPVEINPSQVAVASQLSNLSIPPRDTEITDLLAGFDRVRRAKETSLSLLFRLEFCKKFFYLSPQELPIVYLAPTLSASASNRCNISRRILVLELKFHTATKCCNYSAFEIIPCNNNT